MRRLSLLALANVLLPIAVAVFAIGFFPYKPFLPGLAIFRPIPQYGAPPERVFDKVVFMVVDALRRYAVIRRFATFPKGQARLHRRSLDH